MTAALDIFALRDAGKTVREIAALAGVPVNTMQSRLQRYGIKRRELANSVERPCLCCGKAFLSQGAHNRLCNRCRLQSATAFDSPHAVSVRR